MNNSIFLNQVKDSCWKDPVKRFLTLGDEKKDTPDKTSSSASNEYNQPDRYLDMTTQRIDTNKLAKFRRHTSRVHFAKTTVAQKSSGAMGIQKYDQRTYGLTD